jgi:3-dehydroquinate synthase
LEHSTNPKWFYSDVAVLQTLDDRQLRNGFAEAIKYGIIADREFFWEIQNNHQKAFDRNLEILQSMVETCSQIKTEVVLLDEKETKNIRTILNFGHTLGHAIEAAGNFEQYHHGEAIAIGMRMAADISVQRGLLSANQAKNINDGLSAVGLPEYFKSISLDDILNLMKHDKKFLSGTNRFVLAKSIGEVVVVDDIPEEEIVSAIEKFRKK